MEKKKDRIRHDAQPTLTLLEQEYNSFKVNVFCAWCHDVDFKIFKANMDFKWLLSYCSLGFVTIKVWFVFDFANNLFWNLGYYLKSTRNLIRIDKFNSDYLNLHWSWGLESTFGYSKT